MPEVIRIPKVLPLELRVRIVERYARLNKLGIYGYPRIWDWSEDTLLSKSLSYDDRTGYVSASDTEWFHEDDGYYHVPYQRYLPDHPIPKKFLTDRRITYVVSP